MRRMLLIVAVPLMLLWSASCSGSDTTAGLAGTETSIPAGTGSPAASTALPTVTGPAEVTGEFYPPDEEIPGEQVGESFSDGPCSGMRDIRGLVYRSTWRYGERVGAGWLSDPRLVGHYEHSLSIDLEPEGGRCVGTITGTFVVTGERGSWQGTVTGSTSWRPPDTGVHQHELDYTALGSGEFQGLRLTFHVTGSEYPWSLTGKIESVG